MSTEESVSEAMKVWDEAWNEVTEPETEEVVEEEVVAPEEVSDENAETEEVEETDESEEEESEEDHLEPPKHWSEADKKAFESDDPEEMRKFVLRRHKEMEADYTRKTQEIAPVREVLKSLKPDLDRAGMNEAQGVTALHQFYTAYGPYVQRLQTDPKGVIQELAKQHGVSFEGVAESDYTDPDIKSLKDEIGSLKTELSQYKKSGETEKLSEANRQIESFKSATDESGNPKHPHFEELESRIVSLLTTPGAIPQGTPQERLQAAYEQAVWTVPEYRQSFIDQQQRERDEADAKRRKDAAKKAKKAAGPATGKPADAKQEPKTLRDDLSAELERIGIR